MLWRSNPPRKPRNFVEALTEVFGLLWLAPAVVLWNTVYMKAVLDQLKAEGYHVDDADVAHLSPARYAHPDMEKLEDLLREQTDWSGR
jgi:hypothetical protein